MDLYLEEGREREGQEGGWRGEEGGGGNESLYVPVASLFLSVLLTLEWDS